jgi:hypothetical protein
MPTSPASTADPKVGGKQHGNGALDVTHWNDRNFDCGASRLVALLLLRLSRLPVRRREVKYTIACIAYPPLAPRAAIAERKQAYRLDGHSVPVPPARQPLPRV